MSISRLVPNGAVSLALVVLAGCAHERVQPALVGSNWRAQELEGKSLTIPARFRPTLGFEKGRASGSNGCNHYSANSRETGGDDLHFEMIIHQLAGCPWSDGNDVRFIDALSQTTAYRRQGKRLTLLGAEGRTLVELRSEPAPNRRD